MLRLVLFILTAFYTSASFAQDRVQFLSEDGLIITGDVYHPQKPFYPRTAIVYFHQARSSRGEYRDIAPQLAAQGYLGLAIDQRAGQDFNGIENETAERAREESKSDGFIDALPDMRAAIRYARDSLKAERVVLWGSSYSASLALVLTGKQAEVNVPKIDGVLAFSPGEYFGPAMSVAFEMPSVLVPAFLTSARNEEHNWHSISSAIPATVKTVFIPEGEGKHGSSALLSDDRDEYWTAVYNFLEDNFPSHGAGQTIFKR